jgi:PPOX class probable F420-dependent enzyme
LRLLDESRAARLGTVAENGAPHLVPVCYALDEGHIFIAVDEKPKRATTTLARLRNINRDARVALLVDRWDEDWSKLAWVRVDGTARIHDEGSVLPDALAALRARYPQYRVMALEGLPLIEVSPQRVTGWRAAPGAR